jgi:hypothetical protein
MTGGVGVVVIVQVAANAALEDIAKASATSLIKYGRQIDSTLPDLTQLDQSACCIVALLSSGDTQRLSRSFTDEAELEYPAIVHHSN